MGHDWCTQRVHHLRQHRTLHRWFVISLYISNFLNTRCAWSTLQAFSTPPVRSPFHSARVVCTVRTHTDAKCISVNSKFTHQCTVHVQCTLPIHWPGHCARAVYIVSSVTEVLCTYVLQYKCTQRGIVLQCTLQCTHRCTVYIQCTL